MMDYWERKDLGERMLAALAAAGKNIDALTIADMALTDQFHGGGKPATDRLARLLDPKPGTRILDVGGGAGGPARTLAVEFGCHVTVIDLTASFVRAGQMLTTRLGLADRVSHQVGNALELPFDGGTFDVVWTQNSGMNIADKARLYAGFHRVLKAGGRVAFQEPVAGPVQPAVYPLMWARDPSGSFLVTPDELRSHIERAGFAVRVCDDVSAEFAGPATAEAIPPHTAQRIIMGEALDEIIQANHRNRLEGRILSVQAILERR
jgi:sarcosine/dimethylglycine N-methyltransferase